MIDAETNPEVERVREAIDDADREELEDLENVYATGIGFKETDGDRTGEVALLVHVLEKYDEDELDDDEIVPGEVAGVPTDVVDDDPPTPDIAGNRSQQLRPVPGGVSGDGHADGGDEDGGGGTLGGVFEHPDYGDVAITNRHVAADDDEDATGEPFYQPETNLGFVDPGDEDRMVGEIVELGQWDDDDADGNLDGAVIDLYEDSDDETYSAGTLYPDIEIGEAISEPTLGERYVCAGSRTGWISGECIELDVAVSTGTYSFRNCVRFDRYDTDGDDWSGNSGSLHGKWDADEGVFRPVALHFSGSDDNSTAHPWGDVVDDEKGFGDLEPPSDTEETTRYGTDYEYETTVAGIDVDGLMATAHVLVANVTGSGDLDEETVDLTDATDRVIHDEEVELDSNESEVFDWPLGVDYFGHEIRTNVQDSSQELEAGTSEDVGDEAYNWALAESIEHNGDVVDEAYLNTALGDEAELALRDDD